MKKDAFLMKVKVPNPGVKEFSTYIEEGNPVLKMNETVYQVRLKPAGAFKSRHTILYRSKDKQKAVIKKRQFDTWLKEEGLFRKPVFMDAEHLELYNKAFGL